MDKNTEKLKKSLDWLFDQTYLAKRSFDAILAVSKVYSETSVLGLYGDYFGYTQNVMIGEVQLSLAKIFVENKDSHSIVQVIEQANQTFTEEYFKEVDYDEKESYEELKKKLMDIEKESKKLSCTITKLRRIRNKNLAHLDKKISTFEELESFLNKNMISVRDVHKLIDFAIESILCIKRIVFNVQVNVIEKYDYESEISKIAKAMEFYSDHQNNE